MTNDELINAMRAARAARSPEEVNQHAENVAKAEATCNPAIDLCVAAAERIKANPNADGWVRLCEILKEAEQDKRIASSAGASGFLETVYELAADALTLSNGDAAFAPVTEELRALVKKLRGESRKSRSR